VNILITPAGGNLGTEVSKQLSVKHQVFGGVRSPSTTNQLAGVSYVAFDYDDPASYKNALESIEAVVLQAPPLDAGAFERLVPFLDAVKAANINRVVFVSAYGVDHNDEAPLRKIELKLIKEDFNYTIVRPNFFMENFTSGFAAGPLEHDGIVLASSGEGKLAFVSIKDIAAVITISLSVAGHEGKAYNLTGPEALSHADIAQTISNKLGKDIPYVSISGDELKAGAMKNGLPESSADYLVMLYDLAKQGLMSAATKDVENVLGRQPLRFTEVFTG